MDQGEPAHLIHAKDEASECGKQAAFGHAFKNGFEAGYDFDAENEGNQNRERGDSEGEDDKIVLRAANIRDGVAKKLAAGGEDFGNVTDAFADSEHGADLAWGGFGRFLESFGERAAKTDARGEFVETYAEGAVAAISGIEHGGIGSAAFFDAHLEEIEKKPDAFVAAHGESHQIVDAVEKCREGNDAEQEIDDEPKEKPGDDFDRAERFGWHEVGHVSLWRSRQPRRTR